MEIRNSRNASIDETTNGQKKTEKLQFTGECIRCGVTDAELHGAKQRQRYYPRTPFVKPAVSISYTYV